MNNTFSAQIQQLGWTIAKGILIIALIVVGLGLIVGIFTYGKPRKKIRSSGLLDDALDVGIELSHALIGLIMGLFHPTGRRTDWLDDRRLLAMLRGMSPSEFEEFIAEVFTALGYHTRLVGGSGDGGIDIEMTKDGKDFLVQCKKFITSRVTPHDVRDFYGAIGDRHIDGKGFFITTNIFTIESETFAENKPIELIDGEGLIRLVRMSGALNSSGAPKNNSVA